MEILDITGRVIDLCRMDEAQDDWIKKIKLVLEVLQRNSKQIRETNISKQLQCEIKEDLESAENLIQKMIKNRPKIKLWGSIKSMLPGSDYEKLKDLHDTLKEKIQLILFDANMNQDKFTGK